MKSLREEPARSQYGTVLDGTSVASFVGEKKPGQRAPLDIYRKTRTGSSSLPFAASSNADTTALQHLSSVDGSLPPSSKGERKTYAGEKPKTEKDSPALQYSREEKRAWKYARDAETRERASKARRIALWYVNEEGDRASGLWVRCAAWWLLLSDSYTTAPRKWWALALCLSACTDEDSDGLSDTLVPVVAMALCLWNAETIEELVTIRKAISAQYRRVMEEWGEAASEYEERLGVFGSFLKCSKPRDAKLPLELLLAGDSLVPVGEWRCGSKWACPRCSSRRLYGDALRLRELLVTIARENAERKKAGEELLSVLFVTLTGQHNAGEDLRQHMRDFSSAFSKTMRARPVKKLREGFGFVGSVRCFDHTVAIREGGVLDWHAHLHVLMVFESSALRVGSPDVDVLSRGLFDAWASRIGSTWEDGREASSRAFDVEVVSLEASEDYSVEALADYAAKVCALPAYMTKTKKTDGRQPRGGFSPWELLDNWEGEPGDVFSRAWVEYVAGTKGFHRVDWSSGLAARFGIMDEEEEPVARFRVPAPVALVALSDPAIYDGIKDSILAGDWVRALDVLSPLGLGEYAVEVVSPLEVEENMTAAEIAGEKLRQLRARIAADEELARAIREEEDRTVARTPRPEYPAFEWLRDSEETKDEEPSSGLFDL